MNAALNRFAGLRRDYLAVAALYAADFVLRLPGIALGFYYAVVQWMPQAGGAVSAPPFWQAALAIPAVVLLQAVGVALLSLPVALAAIFAVRPPDHPMQNPPRPDLDARIVRVLTLLLVLLVIGAVQATALRTWSVWTLMNAPATDGDTRLAAQVLGPRYFFDALRGLLTAWLMPVLLWLLRRDYATRAARTTP